MKTNAPPQESGYVYWEYRKPDTVPQSMSVKNGDEFWLTVPGAWYPHNEANLPYYFDGCWFRRKLPAPQTDGWVRFSEREPYPSQYPIWVCFEGRRPMIAMLNQPHDPHQCGTHWKSAEAPPPPPKEPTREEREQEAAGEFDRDTEGNASPIESFLAGVKHGRENP